MVKIRLKRQGQKHRPFYRIVVAQAESGRNGLAIENLGTYNPLAKPAEIKIDTARALHWLSVGAQPTETVVYLLKKCGVLEQYIAQNPKAAKKFKSLNKAIAVMTKESAVGTVEAEPVAATPEPVSEAAPEATEGATS
ncbi:MAG: 30S ribosomal protein S16 [Armatimonadota bacterium]